MSKEQMVIVDAIKVGSMVCAQCGKLPCEHFRYADKEAPHKPKIFSIESYAGTKAAVDKLLLENPIVTFEEFGPEQTKQEFLSKLEQLKELVTELGGHVEDRPLEYRITITK